MPQIEFLQRHAKRVAVALPAVVLAACGDHGSRPASGVDTPAAAAAAAGASAAARRGVASPPVRFAKLEALSEINGNPWASVAEFNLLDANGLPLDRRAWKASADSAADDSPAAAAIDGEPKSIWHTQWQGTAPPHPHWLLVDLGAPQVVTGFRVLPRQDTTQNGSIARFRLLLSADGKTWGAPAAEGSLKAYGDVAAEKTVLLGQPAPNRSPVLAALADRTTDRDQPVVLDFGATDGDGDALHYAATGLPPGVTIDAATGALRGAAAQTGVYETVVSVDDGRGARTERAFTWTVRDAMATAGPGAVRYVKLEAVSEINNNVWSSMAEFNLLDGTGAPLDRKNWKASADSSEDHDPPQAAIDGDAKTVWHTRWQGDAPPEPPHSFIVDLGAPAVLSGFRYLPRQDTTRNGTIGRFRFYASNDPAHWGKPVVQGDFALMGAPTAEKTVYLK